MNTESNFCLPTTEEVSHNCVSPAYKESRKSNKPWRNAAWHALQDYAEEHCGYNREDGEQTRRLRNRFYATANCGSPAVLLRTKIKKLNGDGLSISQALAALYCDDLIDGEAHFWIDVVSKDADLIWDKPHAKIQPQRPSSVKASPAPPQRRFVLRLQELLDDDSLSRRAAYQKIHAEFADELEHDLGLFIKHWPFDEEELSALVTMFEEDTNKSAERYRCELFDFLITEQVIDPNNAREMEAFTRIFLKVSPTPRELDSDIRKARQDTPWNRELMKKEIGDKFRNDLIPGELEYHFHKEWPEYSRRRAATTAV